MNQKTLFIGTLVALVATFVVAVLVYTTQQEREAVRHAEAHRAALVRMHAPTLGPAEAPVTLVEFLDPACETCRAFYPRVKEMLAAHPGRIRLVLRYAPFHNGSEQIVALLEAARRQGQFWPALEALLVTQHEWAPQHTPQLALAWPKLAHLGLDAERLRADMAAPEIARLIAQDLADAQTLGVTRTPEFFVNGKPLPSFGYVQLQALVDEALAGRP